MAVFTPLQRSSAPRDCTGVRTHIDPLSLPPSQRSYPQLQHAARCLLGVHHGCRCFPLTCTQFSGDTLSRRPGTPFVRREASGLSRREIRIDSLQRGSQFGHQSQSIETAVMYPVSGAGFGGRFIRTSASPPLFPAAKAQRRDGYAVSARSTRDLCGSLRVCHSSKAQEAFCDHGRTRTGKPILDFWYVHRGLTSHLSSLLAGRRLKGFKDTSGIS